MMKKLVVAAILVGAIGLLIRGLAGTTDFTSADRDHLRPAVIGCYGVGGPALLQVRQQQIYIPDRPPIAFRLVSARAKIAIVPSHTLALSDQGTVVADDKSRDSYFMWYDDDTIEIRNARDPSLYVKLIRTTCNGLRL